MGFARVAAAAIAVMTLAGCAATVAAPSLTAAVTACTYDPPDALHRVLFVSVRMPACKPPWYLPAARADGSYFGAAMVNEENVGLLLSGKGDWEKALNDRFAASGARRTLLYIHGYRNSAEDSLTRADAIAQATHFDGPVVAFLWPSYDSTLRYTWDENENLWAMREARQVLARLAGSSDEVVVVAHSMGNRIVLDAMRHLQLTDPQAATKVTKLVLASPDVDAAIFGNDLGDIAHGRSVTVYASDRDRALRASKTVHGRRRAGDLRCRKPGHAHDRPCPFAIDPALVKVIDTQPLNKSFVGHGNFIESPEVAADMCRVVQDLPVYRRIVDDSSGALLSLDPEAVPADDACRPARAPGRK